MIETVGDFYASLKSKGLVNAVRDISSGREILWRQAYYMFKDHPVSAWDRLFILLNFLIITGDITGAFIYLILLVIIIYRYCQSSGLQALFLFYLYSSYYKNPLCIFE